MMLDAIRASGGCAVAGREERIVEWMKRATAWKASRICPETAVCLDALEELVAAGKVKRDEDRRLQHGGRPEISGGDSSRPGTTGRDKAG